MSGSTPSRRRRLARERGQALVEFVMILPVFLLIVFAVIEFGKGFNYWIDMTHLANEGARYASVNRWPSCPSTDSAVCTEQLREWVRQRSNTAELGEGGTANITGKGLGPAFSAAPYDGDVPNANDGIVICFPEDATPDVGEAVRVVVHADYTLAVVDGLFSFFGMDDLGTVELNAAATMRLERKPTANRVMAEHLASCPA